MKNAERAFHFVCTREQAWKLVGEHDRFWAANCGCRERRVGGCRRSRQDMCLIFRDDIDASGTGKREVDIDDVKAFFREAVERHLVTRPYRDEQTRTRVEGICFCCDDCCGYFHDAEEVCDQGDLIEKTKMDDCTHCGVCVEVCYFGARKAEEGELVVDRQKCYGCGLCAEICPAECVRMVARE